MHSCHGWLAGTSVCEDGGLVDMEMGERMMDNVMGLI
jgi:hypothetical protein